MSSTHGQRMSLKKKRMKRITCHLISARMTRAFQSQSSSNPRLNVLKRCSMRHLARHLRQLKPRSSTARTRCTSAVLVALPEASRARECEWWRRRLRHQRVPAPKIHSWIRNQAIWPQVGGITTLKRIRVGWRIASSIFRHYTKKVAVTRVTINCSLTTGKPPNSRLWSTRTITMAALQRCKRNRDCRL